MAQESNNRALSEAIRAALERDGVEVSAALEQTLIEVDRLAALGGLVAGVAHEINNPLAYIFLHLGSLRRRLDHLIADAAARQRVDEQLAEALEGAERVRLLAGDLLSLARSDPGVFAAPAPTAPRPSPEGAAAVPAPGPRGRVLVVDDEPLVARALVSLFGTEHQVEMRCDGAAALELLLEDAGFDLVVCDLMMPGLTGMELYEQLRRDRPDYARRFIFMTGGAYTARAAEFSARTRQPLVSKPFDMDELLALVREQLVAVRTG